MALRSVKNITTDPRLYGLVSGPIPRTDQFLLDRAMPVIPVRNLQGVFKVESPRNFAGAPEKSGYRAFGADRVPRLSSGPSDVTYSITEAVSGVSGMTLEEYGEALAVVADGGMSPDNQMALEAAYDARYTFEQQTAAAFFTAANWTTTTAIGNLAATTSHRAADTAWNSDTATPDIDLLAIREWVRDQTYGVSPEQMALRLEHDTLVQLQLHYASSGVIAIGDSTKGIGATGAQRVADRDATIAWIRSITGIQDVEVFSVRRESALINAASSPANVATSGSVWCGVQHGMIRPGASGGTTRAVACAMARVGDWHAYKTGLPTSDSPVKYQVTTELYQTPVILDASLGILVTGCAG